MASGVNGNPCFIVRIFGNVKMDYSNGFKTGFGRGTRAMNNMQFDLFEYSRDTGLRNDVFAALEQFDVAAAWAALERMEAAFPQDFSLPGLMALIDVLEQRDDIAFVNHEAVALVRERLMPIEATALQLFGTAAGQAWLAQCWRETAMRAAKLPFLAKQSDDHAAALFLRAGDWQSAQDAVAAIPSWRRIPAPLGWMAQAQYRLSGLAAAWPLLCELAWMVPPRFDDLVKQLDDPLINGLLKKFLAGFEGDGDAPDVNDLAWFPAWVLIENAALADWQRDMHPPRDGAPQRAAQTLLELLALEKRGQHHAIVELRKRLQGLQPSLYAAYMKTR